MYTVCIRALSHEWMSTYNITYMISAARDVNLLVCGWSLVAVERPEVEDRRPLFERLRVQKEQKQMEWDEQLKLSEPLMFIVYYTFVPTCV